MSGLMKIFVLLQVENLTQKEHYTMKKIILLLSVLLPFCLNVAAQSLDKALEQLETVRMQKGEQSQEYLSVLDSVIHYFREYERLTEALSYRKKHLDIVKQVKSEECLEVAMDLWKLSYASILIGDTIAANTYNQEATAAFDRSDVYLKDTSYYYEYGNYLITVLFYYAYYYDQKKVFYYSEKLDKVDQFLYGQSNCDYLISLSQLSSLNQQAGSLEKTTYYSEKLIDNCKMIDSCNYFVVNMAYGFLKPYYHSVNQDDKRLSMAIEHINKLDAAKDSFLYEKIDALLYLMACYSVMHRTDEGLLYGKRAEQLLVDMYVTTEELILDPKYYEILSYLANNRYIANDYVQGKMYYQSCCDVLQHNGLTKTKDYYDSVFKLFQCASKIGEDYLVVSLAPEIEPLIFMHSETPVVDANDFASTMYGSSVRVGYFEDALKYADESMKLAIILKGDSCWVEKTDNAFAKAQLYQYLGEKQNAVSYIIEGRKCLKNIQDQTISNFFTARFLSLEVRMLTNYDEAIAKNDSVLNILSQTIELLGAKINRYGDIRQSDDEITVSYNETKNLLLDFQKEYATALIDKGTLLNNYGYINQAYEAFVKSLKIWGEVTSKTSDGYVTCQNNIALCQMRMGHYADAINTLDKVSNMVYSNYGEMHRLYVSCLMNYSVYYNNIRDFDKVIEYSNKALEVFKSFSSASLNLETYLLNKVSSKEPSSVRLLILFFNLFKVF